MSQTLTAYKPSLRERIAYMLARGAEGLGADINTQRAIVGKAKDAVDFVPAVGDAVGFNEASRDIQAGNYGAGAAGLGLATLGLIPAVGDLAAKGGKKLLKEAAQEAPKGIRAFHGSPHSFDKFSLDKIGTGEGAQAYGHGLYFAENEGVARGYRDALTGNHSGDMAVFMVDGNKVDNPSPVLKNIVRNGGDAQKFIDSLQPNLQRKRAALESASKADELGLGISDYDLAKMDLDEFEGMISEAQGYMGKKVGTAAPGSMYEVNINANPDDFLDWDKPLSEQSQKVKDALASGSRSLDGFDSFDPNRLVYEPEMAGNRIYDRAKFAGGSPQDAREVLAKQGITGIKYLDAGSRGAGDGSRNYVVFDDKLIDIVRKYGIAGASAMLGYNVLAGANEAQAGELNAADTQFNGGGNMIEVELPDGSIAEFPEGTAPDVIKGALQKRFGAPQAQAQTAQPQDMSFMAPTLEGMKQGVVKIADLGNLATTGLTAGFINPLAAGVRAPFTDKTYSEELQILRDRDQAARDRTGTAGTVAEIGGSIAGMGKLMGAGVNATRFVPQALTGGKALMARMLAGGIEGAAFNTATNVGYGRDATDNLGLATVVGGAAPAVASGVSALGSKIGRKIGELRATPEQIAGQRIYDIAQDVDPKQAMSQLAELGPDAMAIDVLGAKGLAAGRAAANVNPTAREKIESALLGRKVGQNERIVADLEQASGLPVGNTKSVSDLKKEAYAQVSPQISAAYKSAKEAGYDLPLQEFDDILQSPMGRKAYKEGLDATMTRNYSTPAIAEKPFTPTPQSYTKQALKVANNLGGAIGPRPKKPQDLIDFLSLRGLKDSGGELKSLDLKNSPVGKKLLSESGLSLDDARSIAIQNGYIPKGFGGVDDAVEKSSVSDFLNMLDENLRGNKTFSQLDDQKGVDNWLTYKDRQFEKASLRNDATQIADRLDGKVSDSVIERAIRNKQDGMDFDEAIKKARYDDFYENGAAPYEMPPEFNKEPIRNFSNLDLLDNIKRSLDDVSRSSFRSGENARGDIASTLAKDLRTRIDTKMTGKEYETARNLRQGAYRTDEAFDLGESLAGSRIPLGLPQKAGLTPAENRAALSQGYAAKQSENLLNRNSTDGAFAKMNTPQGQEALKAALGPQSDQILKALGRETKFNQVAKAITGNSTTVRQMAELGMFAGGGAIATGYDAATGGAVGLVAALLRKGGPALAAKLATKKSQEIAPFIVDFLTRKAIPQSRPIPMGRLESSSKNKDFIAKLLMSGGLATLPAN